MDDIVRQSLELAEKIQTNIEQKISAYELAFHAKMKKLLNNPNSKVMLIELLDKSFRTTDKSRSFQQIEHVLKKYDSQDFFTAYERFLLFAFLNIGRYAPKLSVPFFVNHIRDDTKSMVLDESVLRSRVLKREDEGITLNLNFIGEEVLGESEAKAREDKYIKAIKSDYITYISVKITTIFSQINILDFEYSKTQIVNRLRQLYELAYKEQVSQKKSKFINLDMEEYRDLDLTIAAFKEALGNMDLEAGIVLQSYIPDSYEKLLELFEFSKSRVQNGLKPIKIRFVKGANMEAELVNSSIKDWPLPTFSSKLDTDSNYKKMLDFILSKDNYKFIKIGIAGHNVFEIAYAYTLAKSKNALESFSFEMLEGMSLAGANEVKELHKIILYAPVCDSEHFNNAIAYLVRRLDENTSKENFMRHSFELKVGSKEWQEQKELFLKSIENIKNLNNSPRRTQNRLIPPEKPENTGFKNEPDTDFILSPNRQWASNIKERFDSLSPVSISAVAKEPLSSDKSVIIYDKRGKKIADVALANEKGIKDALNQACESNFSELSYEDIAELLSKTAQIVRERRGELVGIAAAEVGKVFSETDAEVSEAIDFLEFYPYSVRELKRQNPKVKFSPMGVGVVIAPWNFPVGISAGSISAALAAGNRVIYKPSSLSMLTGYRLCECFWDAGVPRDALIFLAASGSDISKYLLGDSRVSFSILTGGEETAYKMLKASPTLLLSAETGGKNATIVTKMSDRDQAVKNIVHSAFSNSGQKCSATSLLILEDEVYDDDKFKECLRDATMSLNVGNPFEFKNKIGLMADIVDAKVTKAINELESGEEWLVKPFVSGYEFRPGIKYGVKEGAYTYRTELFAPILSVLRARDLADAVRMANSTGYGLTSALESLDEREWEYYLEHIEAGNVYINKPTTGAIVLRQPFGGVKKSAIGFGRKVGIFNYVTQFMNIAQDEVDTNLKNSELSQRLIELINDDEIPKSEVIKQAADALKSYTYHYDNEFALKKDYVNIRGEDNLFSYRAVSGVAYRVSSNDSALDVLCVVLAASVAQTRLLVSFESGLEAGLYAKKVALKLGLLAEFKEQSEAEFCNEMANYERIFYFDELDNDSVLAMASAKEAKVISRAKPLLNGRFELLRYFNERSESISYHRYGNLGARAIKE